MESMSDGFYSQKNNSTVSSFNHVPANISSQVSTVGFNNLKKTPTNTSQTSTLSTASTLKSNALTRLFTKNRSSTNVGAVSFQPPAGNDTSNDKDDSIPSQHTLAHSESNTSLKSSKSKFKIPKKSRLTLKGSNSSSNPNSTTPNMTSKPQLTIQTGGHHGLKISKKILSSGLLNEEAGVQTTGRKNSINSPVSTFHNLFHRSHNNAQHGSPLEPTIEELQKLANIPGRTSLTLSSNNSNSYIADPTYALAYNFTDSDFALDKEENPGETNHGSTSNSFLEIHKKLLVPTDQYLQTKLLHKQPLSEQGIGLGISEDDFEPLLKNDSNGIIFHDYISNYNLDFGKSNAKFFTILLSMTRSLFTPSKQSHLSNGLQHPCLGFSVEDLANFIKNNYVLEVAVRSQESTELNDSTGINSSLMPSELQLNSNTYHYPTPQKSSKNKLKLSKFQRTNSMTSQDSGLHNLSISRNTVSNEIDEFRMREISLDLFTYFVKCMVALRNDLSALEDSKIPYASPSALLQQDCKIAHNLGLTRIWAVLSNVWLYFNQKVRFFLLCMFQPLQSYLRDASIEMSNVSSTYKKAPEFDLEDSLLRAFRDILVIPALLQRQSIYNSFPFGGFKPSYTNETFGVSEPQMDLLQQEENFLKKNRKLLHNLVNCLGACLTGILMNVGPDGDLHTRVELFNSAFSWLSSLA